MHLAERYALGTSSKIETPYVLDTFYPLSAKKYITFHPISKDSKNYSHWEEVLVILSPILKEAGIVIVQVGGKNERPFPFCIHTQGTTSFNDLAYIIKNSLLHLSTDSIAAHFAGHFNIPQVCLFSNNYIECVKSYWGGDAKKILLEPERPPGRKPNFVLSENPKSIDTIKVEKIVESVCSLLGLVFSYPYKSLAIGPLFESPIVESVCNQVVDPKQFSAENIFCRYDLCPDELTLVNQMKVSRINLFANKPIAENIIKCFALQIVELIYEINSLEPAYIQSSLNFLNIAKSTGIRIVLISYLPKEDLAKIKLDFVDFPPILNKPSGRPSFIEAYIEKTGDASFEKLFFKTKRFILSDGSVYLSSEHFAKNIKASGFNDNMGKVIDSNLFWREAEHFYFVFKK
jgi:hypothetical protein